MSLLFNVAQLLKSEVGQTRSYDFESDERIDLDDSEASHVRGHVKFILTNFGILARGEATAVLHLHCARCVEPFQMPTSIEFEEEYQPLIDVTTGLPSATLPNDTAFVISQNHTINLTEAIRQNLVLAVELIPICRPDCKGLCPDCGSNLNLSGCDCPPMEEASPFAVLQGLLAEADVEK